MKKTQLIVLLLLMNCFVLAQSGQDKIDSLRFLMNHTKEDSLKKYYLYAIGDEFRLINNDSAEFYATQLKKKIENRHFLWHKAELLEAFVISEKGAYKKAIQKLKSTIPFFEKINDYKTLGIIYNALNVQYSNLGEYDKSILFAQKTAEYATKSNDQELKVRAYFSMGIDYFEIKEYHKSIDYYQKALDVAKEINYKDYITYIHNNLANNYAHIGAYEEAIFYANKTIEEFTQNGKTRLLSYPYVNLGTAYKGLREYKLSESYYLKAIKIKTENQDEKDLIITQGYLADLYLKQKRFEDAQTVATQAYQSAKKLGLMPEIVSTSGFLAKAYVGQDDFKNASHFYEINSNAKDSLSVTEKSKEIFRLQTKYETAEKEKTILSQEVKLQNRKIWILRIAAITVIVGLLGLMFFFKQRHKLRQQQKDNELKIALTKIENQTKLQEQRLKISRDLHDNIGSQLTFIISSIDTTKMFLDAKNDKLNERLSKINAFTRGTIAELRDTIWAMNHSEIGMDELRVRILNFIENADFATDNIDFKFVNTTLNAQNYVLNSKNGMNVYRILQEAINNAIKHAEAKRIDVVLKEEEAKVFLDIIDNGNGFDLRVENDGNGLKSMQKRAEELQGSISIQSDKDGTKITLKIPKDAFQN